MDLNAIFNYANMYGTINKEVIMEKYYKNNHEYINLMTGKTTSEKPAGDFIFCKQNRRTTSMAVFPIGNEAICMKQFFINTYDDIDILGNVSVPREWEPTGNVVVITKNKDMYRSTNLKSYKRMNKNKSIYASFKYCNETYDTNEIINAFKTVYGRNIFVIGGNGVVAVKSPYDIEKFVSYKEIQRKNNPKQKKIDNLTSYTVSDIENWLYCATKDNSCKKVNVEKSLAVIDTINNLNNTLVIRLAGVDDNNIVETARIYVNNKEYITCKQNFLGEWVATPMNMNMENWRYPLFINNDKINEYDTKLKYFLNILYSFDESKRVEVMIAFLQYPFLESLYKTGYQEEFLELIKDENTRKLSQTLCKYFGEINIKGKNFFDVIGVTKKQFEILRHDMIPPEGKHIYYEEYYLESYIPYAKLIKSTLQKQNISDIDDKTFNGLIDVFSAYRESNNSEVVMGIVKTIIQNYGMKSFYSIKESLISIANITYGREAYCEDFPLVRTYLDYIYMTSTMKDIKEFRPQFDINNAVEDICNKHDAAMAIFNVRKYKYKEEKFLEAIKRVKKYEYTDGEYIIKIPDGPGDIVNEGLKLHHCVKSYIERIINGYTNIVFIRKVAASDEPFFTVEISNTGTVEQIHGLFNSNIGTSPEVIPFIEKWIKIKNLKANDYNKLR